MGIQSGGNLTTVVEQDGQQTLLKHDFYVCTHGCHVQHVKPNPIKLAPQEIHPPEVTPIVRAAKPPPSPSQSIMIQKRTRLLMPHSATLCSSKCRDLASPTDSGKTKSIPRIAIEQTIRPSTDSF